MRRRLSQRLTASSLHGNSDADKQDAGDNQSGSAPILLGETSSSEADLLTVSGQISRLDQRTLLATESPVPAAPGTSSPTGRPISPFSQITPLSGDAPSISGHYEALHDKDGQIEEQISKTQEKHTNSPIASQDIHPHTYDLGHTENRMYPDPEKLQSQFKAPAIVVGDLDRNRKQELQKLHTQGVKSDWDPQRQTIKDQNREVNAVAFSKDSQVAASALASRGKMVRPWETRFLYRWSLAKEMRELEMNLRTLGDEHPSTSASIQKLASKFRNKDQWKMAEAMYKRALQGYEKTLGPDHKSTLEAVGNLGSLYKDQGRLVEAKVMYERALQGEEKALGSHAMITFAPALSPLENVATALDDAMAHNYQALLGSGRSEGPMSLSIAAQEGYERVVRMLLEAGADVNFRDTTNRRTPLLLAAESGHKEVVRMLLAAGADVNLGDINDTTALWLATWSGYKEVIRMLLAAGADINLRDVNNITPLLSAAGKGDKEVVRMLLDLGEVDVNTRDSYGMTPLSLAASRGDEEVVRMLLDAGADVNLSDTTNRPTPLLLAAESGHEKVVRMLLDAGADVNLRGIRDETPLSLAKTYGQKEVIRILLGKGEVEEQEDDYGGSNDAEKRMTLSARDGLGTYALQEHTEQNAAQGEFKRKRTLPELVDEWFPQWFDSFWEPRIPPGAERIRWTCACGKRLYDDYYGLQPGTAQVIRAKLVGSTTRSPTATSLTTGDRSLTGWIASCSQWAAPIVLAARKAIGRGTTASNDISLDTSPQTPLNNAPKRSLFLLFCVQAGQEGKGRLLHQEDVPASRLSNDRNLFEFLRDIYGAKRKWRSRITLRAVSAIGNCKLHVDFSRLVSKLHKHYDACYSNNAISSCPCWPDPTNSKYRYIVDKPQEPFDMEKNYILHCFQHPECLDPLQRSVICHVPMKKDTQLTGMAYKPNPGWGIYFEEGWHFKTIWVITLVLLLISFMFSVTWWFVMSDIQGAFGVGSYCVTVAALFLGFLAQRSF